MNVVRLGGDVHQEVQSLLPWYVTGRLTRAEIDEVEAHLAGCAGCQAELAWERKLQVATAAPEGLRRDAERGLAVLRKRIETSGDAAPRAVGRRSELPWLRWALAAQFAAIVGLVTLLVAPRFAGEPYHALGTPGHAAAGNVVVRFRHDASEADIRRTLNRVGARLVDGPTATDAYLLSVPAERQAAALA
ncbi:MAG TPA: zf-HC2 domain-containing protein, partial [Albitalea sp.]|nr:zf-HC2 domain-containing protein [Albitalea sp.]